MTITPTTPRTPVRNPDLMRANAPEVATARAGVDAALAAFALAAPYLTGSSMWWSTSEAPAEYRDQLRDMVEAVQFAKAGPDLTNEAKWRKVDGIIAAWLTKAEALIGGVERQVAEWDRDLTARAMPPAPIADRGDLEAALANARSDALLALGGATEEDVAARLGALARSPDPVLAYLIVATPWAASYFRGRGMKVAPIAWAHEREQVLGGILDGEALAAYRKLAGIPHARKAATALRLGHSLTVAGDRDHFGVDGDAAA